MKYPDKVLKPPGKLLSIFSLILFFALGFLVTNILNTKLPQEKQTVKSQAQGLSPIQEATCTAKGGECQTGKSDQVGKECTLSDGKTKGTVIFNLCPQQSNDVRCCVPKTSSNPDVPILDKASLTVEFQGIGPNANPLNKTRYITIKIFKNEGPFERADYVAEDNIVYDGQDGKFKSNNFNLGALPDGKYQMVIQEERYLDAQLTNKNGDKAITVSGGVVVEMAPVTMIAGDLAPGERGDNFINIIDYNAIIGCMPGAPSNSCFNRDYADLNDDGKVDQIDFDILMKNFGEDGFAFQTDQFKCEPDPGCGAEKGSLQLCSLLCTKKTQRS